MAPMNTLLEDFVSDPVRRLTYEREALAIDAMEIISDLMEREQVTKVELAGRLKKSKAHVTQVLSGSRNMTLHTLAEVLFALGYKAELRSSPLVEARQIGKAPFAPRNIKVFRSNTSDRNRPTASRKGSPLAQATESSDQFAYAS
ncbi:MAG: hypothetical protein SGI92_28795 [Bryobacteraceae bacterium]|nr:hypothetical protein [Bryobacteraceae bacterium]